MLIGRKKNLEQPQQIQKTTYSCTLVEEFSFQFYFESIKDPIVK